MKRNDINFKQLNTELQETSQNNVAKSFLNIVNGGRGTPYLTEMLCKMLKWKKNMKSLIIFSPDCLRYFYCDFNLLKYLHDSEVQTILIKQFSLTLRPHFDRLDTS